MRVLLVGMTHADNPFTRALEKYEGIEVEMIANDSGDRLKHIGEVSAAIFANAVIDHGKFWKAKDVCKERGIPMFHSSAGFSPIKEQFENWLQESGHVVTMKGNGLPVPNTAFAEAFRKANEPKQSNQAEAKPMSNDDDGRKQVRDVNPEQIERTKQIIIDAANNGYNAKDTIHLLEAEGFKENSWGNPWSLQLIQSARSKYRKAGFIRPDAFTSSRGRPAGSSTAKTSTKNIGSAVNQMELIGKVMTAKGLTSDRKVELVEEIHAGLITTENSVMTVRTDEHLQLVMRNIFSAEDKPLVYLDKLSAIAIMQSLEKIQELADS